MDVSAISATSPPVATPAMAEARGAEPAPPPRTGTRTPARGDPAAQPDARGTPDDAPGHDLKFTLSSADAQARFVLLSDSRRVMVTIYHRETGEVIREIPPKRIQNVLDALAGRGLVVDEKG